MTNNKIFIEQYIHKEAHYKNPPLLFRLLSKFEEHRYDAIARMIPNRSESSVADLGCGNGSFLIQNSKRWKKAVGLDGVKELIQEASKKNTLRSISFLNHNLGEQPLPFPDKAFSMVISIATLQYIHHLDDTLREIHRVLQPRGHFILEVPNFLVFWRRIQLLFGQLPTTSQFQNGWNGGVLHHFSYEKLIQLCENYHFTVVKSSSSGIFSSLRNIYPPLLGANIILLCQKK